jgi:hypothetical protein
MTFNNSCSYAGVANMLEDFNINIEDYELAIRMKVPFIFKYDETWGRYISGAMLQEHKYFNYYLQKLGLRFTENQFNKEDALISLHNLNNKAMIGLNINGMHAVIYCGIENGKYIFLNNRRKNSNEPKYYKYDLDELRKRMNQNIVIGYIEKDIGNLGFDIKEEMENSILYLEKYRSEVENFCTKEQYVNSLKWAMNSLFRALFLDIYSMMDIIGEKELVKLIAKVRADYLNAMNLNKTLNLSEYISLSELNKIIDEYRERIKLEISNSSYNDGYN